MLNSIGLAEPRARARSSPSTCRGSRARRPALGLRRRLLAPRTTPRSASALDAEPASRRSSSTSRCPNVEEAPETAAELVAAARAATTLPLYAKLSPAVPDVAELARAVEAAGADGLSLVNTIRGLALDDGAAAAARARRRRLLRPGAEADRARRRLRLHGGRRPADRRHGRRRRPAATRSSSLPRERTPSRSARSSSPTRTRPAAIRAELAAEAARDGPRRPGRRSGTRSLGRARPGGDAALAKSSGLKNPCKSRVSCRLHRAVNLVASRAHGDRTKSPTQAPAPVTRPADGGPQAGQRHPRQARPAQEGPQGRARPDRGRSSAIRPTTSRPRRCSTCSWRCPSSAASRRRAT